MGHWCVVGEFSSETTTIRIEIFWSTCPRSYSPGLPSTCVVLHAPSNIFCWGFLAANPIIFSAAVFSDRLAGPRHTKPSRFRAILRLCRLPGLILVCVFWSLFCPCFLVRQLLPLSRSLSRMHRPRLCPSCTSPGYVLDALVLSWSQKQ